MYLILNSFVIVRGFLKSVIIKIKFSVHFGAKWAKTIACLPLRPLICYVTQTWPKSPSYSNTQNLPLYLLLLSPGLFLVFINNHFFMLLDLTVVCPLLTKQYTQVGLQIQYIFFRWSLSPYMVRLRVLVIRPLGSSNNNQSTISAHQFNNQLDHRSITKWANVRTEIWTAVLHDWKIVLYQLIY
jgi:hypothetical protein